MTYLYGEYIAHHGVKGQKWGVRRYQNDDGTLTAAGRERYGDQRTYGDNIVRKTLGGDWGQGAAHHTVQNSINKKLAKAEKKGKERKAEKLRQQKEAYDAAEANQRAYRSHTSTAKLIAQNATMGVFANGYRHARARGETRAAAFLEANPLTATPVRLLKDKKAYGQYVLHGDKYGYSL